MEATSKAARILLTTDCQCWISVPFLDFGSKAADKLLSAPAVAVAAGAEVVVD